MPGDTATMISGEVCTPGCDACPGRTAIHDCLIAVSAGGEKNQETILDLVELISRI